MALITIFAAGVVTSGLLWYGGMEDAAFAVLILVSTGSLGAGVLVMGHQLRGALLHAVSEVQDEQRRLTVAGALEVRSTAIIAGQFPDLLMPQTGFSMASANLVGLLDLLVTLRPKSVLELGSGFSTILIAAWLKRQGEGHLVSIEHEPFWAEKTRIYVRMQGLDQQAEVRDVPLAPRQIDKSPVLWYDLEDHIGDLARIDLLVVDGPPSQPGQMTRWPALPVLHRRLANGAAIFVDDGSRRAERAMVDAWKHDFPGLSSHYTATLTGYWILRAKDPEQVSTAAEDRHPGTAKNS
jgi:predicted O-methyltransferase YrrM